MLYDVEGAECGECPVAYITPESQELVDLFFEASRFQEAGASAFGPDLSRWDARMVDAQSVIEGCREATLAALRKALAGE